MSNNDTKRHRKGHLNPRKVQSFSQKSLLGFPVMEMFWIFAEDLGFEETLLYDKGPLYPINKTPPVILFHTISQGKT